MIMDCGYLNAVLDKLRHHRIDFGLQQNKIAHRHDPAAHRLERHPAAEGEGRFNGHAIKCHLEVGSWETIAMHVSGYHGGLTAERLVDVLPIHLLSADW